jgi:hypothetical protein
MWDLFPGRERDQIGFTLIQNRADDRTTFWGGIKPPKHHGAAEHALREEDAQGYQILHWNGAETTCWVVSDLNNTELLQLAQALRGH